MEYFKEREKKKRRSPNAIKTEGQKPVEGQVRQTGSLIQMERRKVHKSEEEYVRELVGWGKQWIQEYCVMATMMQPDGKLTEIRGMSVFGHELEMLCDPPFTEMEQMTYEDFTKRMLSDMVKIHKKGHDTEAMEHLHQIYAFSEFEWFMVVMAFMVEIDQQFERVFCLLQDDYEKKEPSMELCIQMFTLREEKRNECRRQVIRRWDVLEGVFSGWIKKGILEPGRGSLFSMPLKLDDRIIRFLFNTQSEDPYFREVLKLYQPHMELSPMLVRKEQVKRLAGMQEGTKGGFVYISGAPGIGKKFLVRHYCMQEEKRLLLADVPSLESEVPAGRQTVRRLFRELRLQGDAVLCFDGMSLREPEHRKLFGMILDELDKNAAAPVFLSPEEWDVRLDTKGIRCMELALHPLTVEERGILWKGLLEGLTFDEEIHTSRIASRYQLTPGAIALAVEEVGKRQMVDEGGRTEKFLYQAVQNQLAHRLGNDAVRIPVMYSMEDLILPASQKQLLKNACNLVEYRHQVYDKWGFGSKMAYGRGLNMIFYGPPGTGKTMGAQAVAGELDMEIYRVDMSSVLSKYVGESEKKLANIFEQGQKSQGILFFDEADALFGKRSEVRDAQDKYANASTAYLLQKIEEYQGVVILATNLLQNFDTAFGRRFQFIIEFPLPDIGHRLEIWKRVFPGELPLQEEIDFEYLAEQFTFSGSQIKSIAVASAFLAAGEGEELSMRLILESIRREMKKVGKNMIGDDFGKYCSLMEG